MNYWDICGGDVLVKAQGGTATQFNFKPLEYERENEDAYFVSTIFTQANKYYERLKEIIDLRV
jgi:3'-phosphoadenosine 5'-phosphosulfate (PAPS) 3'-phosphatase